MLHNLYKVTELANHGANSCNLTLAPGLLTTAAPSLPQGICVCLLLPRASTHSLVHCNSLSLRDDDHGDHGGAIVRSSVAADDKGPIDPLEQKVADHCCVSGKIHHRWSVV